MTRDLFAFPRDGYDSQLFPFGQSYNGVERKWDEWLTKFEHLLRSMYWTEAHVYLDTEIWGNYHYIWKPSTDTIDEEYGFFSGTLRRRTKPGLSLVDPDLGYEVNNLLFNGNSSLTALPKRACDWSQALDAFVLPDSLDRLTTGSIGDNYHYSDVNHFDAVTSYDMVGDMVCRAPISSQTCSGMVTGQALTYDALNRMIQWQNAQSSPTSTAFDAYDGEGHQIWQQTASGGVTTTIMQ